MRVEGAYAARVEVDEGAEACCVGGALEEDVALVDVAVGDHVARIVAHQL